MRSLVTGGTGFVGQHLIGQLDRPVVLGRNLQRIHNLLPDVEAREWNPGKPVDPDVFAGIDTVFHLAGEPVSRGRWSAAKKKRIKGSRIESTRSIVQALEKLSQPPKTFICSSAIGYYGSQGKERLTESSPPGDDFLANVCIAWEEEARKAEKLGVRVILLRIGIVLGRDGGALPKMLLPFKLGLGGRLGNGRQYMSWIHIDDLVGIMLYAAANEKMQGPYNGVSPQPVTNRDFTRALAEALHRPAPLPVPGFVLRLAVGEFAKVLLGSQKVIPGRTIQSGYTYSFPRLPAALADLIGK
ncbi:MAG: TIGR01777 family oxidoreductase [Desulfobulbaceae bacterium]|nr:TIGR01777 family oxidoreductase [Desulfobulbaceae bacterium]